MRMEHSLIEIFHTKNSHIPCLLDGAKDTGETNQETPDSYEEVSLMKALKRVRISLCVICLVLSVCSCSKPVEVQIREQLGLARNIWLSLSMNRLWLLLTRSYCWMRRTLQLMVIKV